jgi:hypothetical protein
LRSPANLAATVYFEAVRVDLKACILQETEIQGTFVELRDVAAGLADQVVVMVSRQLETRAIP